EFLESLTEAPVSEPATLPTPAGDASPGELHQTPVREQRSKSRFSSQRVTSCKALERIPDPEQSWTGQVVNISQGGLCLEINRRFERGTMLTVVLENEEIKRRSLVVRVIWVKQLSPASWKLGCRLDQPLCEFE